QVLGRGPGHRLDERGVEIRVQPIEHIPDAVDLGRVPRAHRALTLDRLLRVGGELLYPHVHLYGVPFRADLPRLVDPEVGWELAEGPEAELRPRGARLLEDAAQRLLGILPLAAVAVAPHAPRAVEHHGDRAGALAEPADDLVAGPHGDARLRRIR